MKIDLSTLFEMIEQEDKNLSKTSAPVKQEKQEKQKETALDLQGLFSLFEQLEPQLGEAENLEGFEDVEMVLKFAKIPITSKLGNRETQDHKYFGEMVSALTGGTRDPVEVFTKIKKVQEQLLSTPNLEIREIVSGMVIIEAFYSFFNAFYSISSDKQKQGIKLGFFAESFAAGLYGANTTIPYGFGNDTLFTVADFLYSENGKDVPISLKTRQQTGHLGSRFRVLHDLVKYGKVYFDIFKKSSAGASNVYNITFERRVLTMDDAKDIAREAPGLLAKLENIYSGLSENIIYEKEEDSIERVGYSSIGPKYVSAVKAIYYYYLHKNNLWEEKIKQVEKLLQKIESLWGAPLSVLSEESPEEIERFKLAKAKENTISYYYSVIGKILTGIQTKNSGIISSQNAFKRQKEQFFNAKERKEEEFISFLKGKKLTQVPSVAKALNTDEELKKAWGQILEEYPNIEQPEQQPEEPEQQPEEQPEEPVKLSQMDIFLQQYPDQKNKITAIREVEKLNKDYPGLTNIQESETRESGESISITLDPDKLREIFKNGNDSLEKNYRKLVQRMNSLSELMKRYFLNPTPSVQDGENLKNAAKTLGTRVEKAVEKNPIKK